MGRLVRKGDFAMAIDDIAALVESFGFECVGTCAAVGLRARADVREMCAADRCRMFGRNWSCPPACGDIGACEALMHDKARCIVVQTVRNLEDEFDVETMMEAERIQKERMLALADALRDGGREALVLTSGACTLCAECTYPGAPCRFPNRRYSSMEAFGLMVSEVCALAGVPYTHGAGTIAYTGALLV